MLQRVVAAALKWPIARVRIVAPDPGGGFGGKGWPKFEPLLAVLALRLGRPVRLVLTLEETFQQARRTSARIHAKTGFDREGRIVSQELNTDFLIGAYADIGVRVVSKASYAACGPYRTPQRESHRASAAIAHDAEHGVSWIRHTAGVVGGRESADRSCRASRDRSRRDSPAQSAAERRSVHSERHAGRRRLGRQRSRRPPACIDWHAPLASNRGRGIALGLKSSSTASASLAIVRLHYDASVSVLSGTSDMGQGARTVLAQIAGKELGASPDRVVITLGDTSIVPYDSSTSASRSTVFMGNAVIKACEQIRRQLQTIAARALAIDEAAVDVGRRRSENPERSDVICRGNAGRPGAAARRDHRRWRRAWRRVSPRASAGWTAGVLGIHVHRGGGRSRSRNRHGRCDPARARERRRKSTEPAAGRGAGRRSRDRWVSATR